MKQRCTTNQQISHTTGRTNASDEVCLEAFGGLFGRLGHVSVLFLEVVKQKLQFSISGGDLDHKDFRSVVTS